MGNPELRSGASVVFLYAYAGSPNDAVARAIDELAAGLTERGVRARVLARWRVDGHERQGLRRVLFQAGYLGEAARVLLLPRAQLQTVITVDVPIGVRFLAEAWRRVSPRRRHIAWTMDIYAMQPRVAERRRLRAGALRKLVERSSLRKSERIVSLGQCMASLIHAETGRNSVVIPLWQDDDWLQPSTEGHRGALDEVEFLYSGHAGEAHPLLPLANAIKSARARGVRVRLSIVGHGSRVAEVRAWLRSNNDSGVTVCPPLPRVAALDKMRRADVHVSILDTSYTGTCVPSKTYAGMALGKPVLFLGSTTCQGAVDVARADAGVVADPASPEAIAAAIERLSISATRDLMGSRGRGFYARYRTLDTAIQQWVPLIEGRP